MLLVQQHKPVYIKPDLQLFNSYMLRIYNYMVGALILTGLVAELVVSSDMMKGIMYVVTNEKIISFSPLGWVIVLAPLCIALSFTFGLSKMNELTAQIMFWSYAILLGLSLSSVFLIYTDESIANIFFITTAMFAGMSAYGYFTKIDLSGIASYCTMALIGIIAASLVNIFLDSSDFNFAISIITILIFTGLTAFDTQRIRAIYHLSDSLEQETMSKIAIICALTLYLDFLNIFVHLLQVFGIKKEK